MNAPVKCNKGTGLWSAAGATLARDLHPASTLIHLLRKSQRTCTEVKLPVLITQPRFFLDSLVNS